MCQFNHYMLTLNYIKESVIGPCRINLFYKILQGNGKQNFKHGISDITKGSKQKNLSQSDLRRNSISKR